MCNIRRYHGRLLFIMSNVREDIGLGVDFVSMRGRDHDVILKVIKRLLA
jgi:hypothetical protein